MESYTSRKIQFSAEFGNLKKKYNLISFLRLLCILFALVSLFYYIKTQQSLFEITAIILVIIFIILIRFHSKLSNRIKHLEALISINENEILFLKKEKIPFENGIEFTDFSHPYSYDLDIFGENSLLQNLNRTYTFIGKKILSHRLLGILPNDEILLNQVAIKELSKDLDWRQKFAAFAKSAEDNESFYTTLLRWCSFNSESL